MRPTTPVLCAGAFVIPHGATRYERRSARTGTRIEVAVYAVSPAPEADGTYVGGVFVEGHPEYDPPRHVFGGSPFQVLEISFDVVRRHMAKFEAAFYVDTTAS